MKKILCILMCIVLLAGCGENDKKGIEVDYDTGTFMITSEEFIEKWNSSLDAFKKNSKDAKAEYLISIPESASNGLEAKLDEYVKIQLNDDHEEKRLKKITLMWCAFGQEISNEEMMTLGFMIKALPQFIDPDTDFDIMDEFNIEVSNEFLAESDIEGDFRYTATAVNGCTEISIEPVKLNKK